MAYKKVYDLKKVSVNIGTGDDAFPIEGLMSVSAARNEDEYTTFVAADGKWRNVRNNNTSGTITMTLANFSESHQLLMLLHMSGFQFPIAVVDKTSNGAVMFGDGCMLSKPPDMSRELEEGETEYVFICGNLQINHAGYADAPTA
jgi:hypothetical protein